MRSQLPPLTTRITQIICAIAWCLVAAGPVFGFAAIKPIFISQHIYENKCDLSTTTTTTTTTTTNEFISNDAKCVEQDLSLNFYLLLLVW